MAREVTKDELRAAINDELAQREECPGCRIYDVFLLGGADAWPCNWERGAIRCAEHCIDDKCRQVVDHVTAWAKSSYRLKVS